MRKKMLSWRNYFTNLPKGMNKAHALPSNHARTLLLCGPNGTVAWKKGILFVPSNFLDLVHIFVKICGYSL